MRYRHFLKYPLSRWRSILVILVLTAVTSVTAALQPWPMKLLVDFALGELPVPAPITEIFALFSLEPTSFGLVICSALAALGLYVINSALDVGLTWIWSRAGQAMVYDLSVKVFQRFQQLSLLFHQDRTVGDSLSRLTEDTYCVYTLTSALLVAPLQYLLTLASVGFLAWQLDPFLAVLCFVIAPLVAASARFFGTRLKRKTRLVQEARARLISFVHQTLTVIPMVQSFHTEARNTTQFRVLADEAVRLDQWGNLVTSSFELVNGSIMTVSRAMVLFIGARQVLLGSMTVGSLLVFLAYLQSIQKAFQGLLSTYGQLKSTEANLDRVLEVLDTEPKVKETPAARPLTYPVTGRLQFKGVTFGYQSGVPILHDIDLDISSGETIAFVGATGAGKSTLMSLVPRFLDPWQGSILLDGRDIKYLKLKEMRSQIGLVLQDPFLLPLSVAENIAYGRPAATRAEIVQAAQLANADNFIRQLAEGYDTVVGERGANLSGGQKQRLSIARALLKNSPVLILDEPTSALDVATEASIMEALEYLMAGRTTLIVAHRLSTVQRADRIVVLEKGRVAEVGSHQELLRKQGVYFQLHAAQLSQPNDKALGEMLS